MKEAKYNIMSIFVTLLLILLTTSCSEADMLSHKYQEYEDVSNRFDFKTSEYMPLSIQCPAGYYVALYERDPRQSEKAMPFFSTFIDPDGKFSEDVNVPQHLIGQEIYVSANGNVFKSKLTNKGISYAPSMSRDGENNTLLVDYDYNKEIKSHFDKIMIKNRDNSKLVDTSRAGVDVETKEDNTEIVFSLVNVTGRYMMQMYYFYYPAERTAPGQSDFQNANKMAEFIKRFMRPEFCISRNWGNKYTGKDEKPGDTGAVYNENGASGWINRNYAAYLNSEKTTVKLKYYGWFNKMGEFSNIESPETTFPKDYKIGFFMYVAVPQNHEWVPPTESDTACNEYYYNDINKTSKHYIISTDRIINYEIKPTIKDGVVVAEPFVHHDRMCATRLLSYNTNNVPCIVYGMEDDLTGEGDPAKDFNDIFFTVQTNPLVDLTDISVIGEGYYAYDGTLLYEDLYPKAGDYDMNDVIVEYAYTMHYQHITNKGNQVTSIDYEFIPVWNGATYTSDFYLNIKQDNVPDQQIKICENVNAIAESNAARISKNISEGKDVTEGLTTFRGTIDVNSGLDLSHILGKYVRDLDVRYKVFDPFIYVQDTNYEVHTPGNEAVLPSSFKCDDPLLSKYHIGAEDMHYAMGLETPFAVNISLRSYEKEPGFRECAESYTINSCYFPYYADWVSSKGASSKTWYMRYNYTGPK